MKTNSNPLDAVSARAPANERALVRAIHQNEACAIYTVNPDGIITSWNRGAQKLLGYDEEQMIGSHCRVINNTSCAGNECVDGRFTCPLLSRRGVWSRQCTVRHKSGRLIPILKTGQVLEADGNVIGGMETLIDITAVLAGQDKTRFEPQAHLRRPSEAGEGVMVGEAACMRGLRALAAHASESDVSVLLLGESGTGKELLAEGIHRQSRCANQPFVKVDCATLSETLLESELFGHAKGAFTGASASRLGRFEIADGGTIFLDEIGDITPHVQKKLLRFLQSREFERVGDNTTRRVSVRVISATHRDLKKMVERGTFREDLYWRLSAFPIQLPPLRERMDDVVSLAKHFLAKHWRRNRADDPPTVGKEVRRLLLMHNWPGNCRELENVMWYAATLARDGEVLPQHLPPQLGRCNGDNSDATSLLTALDRCKWNRSRAASMLGISRVTLWRRMQKLGISAPSEG